MEKVISGGQTGADQGALLGARDAGVPTGGTAVLGWWTDGGPTPQLAELGLSECRQSGYPARTHANVRDSCATLIFGNPHSPGCQLTERLCVAMRRPHVKVRWPPEPTLTAPGRETAESCLRRDALCVLEWLALHEVRILNVAGNRERLNPGVGEACRAFVAEVLRG